MSARGFFPFHSFLDELDCQWPAHANERDGAFAEGGGDCGNGVVHLWLVERATLRGEVGMSNRKR
jgi:hypothetical protein